MQLQGIQLSKNNILMLFIISLELILATSYKFDHILYDSTHAEILFFYSNNR